MKKNVYTPTDKIKKLKQFKLKIALMIQRERLNQRLTQRKLAERVGTDQPSIARLESGTTVPSLNFLLKVSDALNKELLPPTFG